MLPAAAPTAPSDTIITDDIVSRITLARYPKQHDLIAYAMAISSVAGGVAAGWYSWCGLASRQLRGSRETAGSLAGEEALDLRLRRWSLA